jgi:hypothetical protein
LKSTSCPAASGLSTKKFDLGKKKKHSKNKKAIYHLNACTSKNINHDLQTATALHAAPYLNAG